MDSLHSLPHRMDGGESLQTEKPIVKKQKSVDPLAPGKIQDIQDTTYEKPIAKKSHASEMSSNKRDLELGEESEKPIKKRKVEDGSVNRGNTFIIDQIREKLHKSMAKKDVSISSDLIDKVVISYTIKPNKFPTEEFEESNFNITYEYRGQIYQTKTDVANALTTRVKEKVQSPRHEAFTLAKLQLETLHLPRRFDVAGSPKCGIELRAIGSLRSLFCSAVQLYPVGYSITLFVNRGSSQEEIHCSIHEIDGAAEFRIRSGDISVRGVTEEIAWKNFDPDEIRCPYRSFFVLEIELLLEGLEGALQCKGYKFHCERGYGVTYHTNDEAMLAKDRASRGQRSKQKLADKKLALEDHNKTKKTLTEGERARKDLEKNTSKMIKSQSQAQKKLSKEAQKREDKVRGQLKKEIVAEMRRNRVEAQAAVLQCFDTEEEADEATLLSRVPSKENSRESVDELISSLPSCTVGESSEHWEDLVVIANTLLLFRDTLKLNVPTDIDTIAALLIDSTKTAEESHMSIEPVQPVVLAETEATISSEVVPAAVSKGDDSCDEEWDETVPVRPAEFESAQKASDEGLSRQRVAKAYLERIMLSLLRQLSDDLNSLLEITDKNEKKTKVLLPLNHLTWAEYARMLLVSRAALTFNELWTPKAEELLFIVKGNKGLGFRSNKSIARNIRYKLIAETEMTPAFQPESRSRPIDYNSLPCPPTTTDFFTDIEVEQALESVAADVDYDTEYRRCAKVLLKVMKTSAAKYLLWEVDSNNYPYYYSIIKRPMMICNVATNLVLKAYGEENVSCCFYRDVCLSALNCFAFYSETQTISAHAIKILHTLRRHMLLWVWGPEVPPIEQCSDSTCTITHAPIQSGNPPTMIKCSKCSASFSVSALDSFHDFAHIAPSNESVTNYQDEWYCYLCVQEDSSADVDNFKDGLPFTTPLFRLNEWGLSSAMPWFLNDDIVTRTVEFIEDDENRVRLEALRIICLQEMSSTLSVEDKLVVIHALCDLLKYNTKCIDHVSKLQSECSKLMKMVTKESIREAELLEIIKSMIGDRATGMLHYFFEGMDGSEDVIRSRVTEGRCGICRGSTFPGDLSEDEHVLLCDRCNGEVHLKCLNRTEVPKGLWHCSSCSEKIALRETALSHAFNDMDQYRSRLVEDDIIDEMIDAKQAKQELSGGHVCEYCSMTEYELCSPLVVGQSRYEHQAYLDARQPQTVSDFLDDKKDTAIKLIVRGQVKNPPQLTAPFFPSIETPGGKELMCRSTPAVHELCALNMLKARMEKDKHAFRRRRKSAAERVTWMTGLTLQPLGYDDSGREYWVYPTSNDLFICLASSEDIGRIGIRAALRKGELNSSDILKEKTWLVWKRVTELKSIKILTDLLSKSHNEAKLKQALTFHFFSDAAKAEVVPVMDNKDAVATDSVENTTYSSQVVKIKAADIAECAPAELCMVFPPKCLPVDRTVVIEEEEAFDAELDEDDDDEEEGLDCKQYLKYNSRRSIYHAIAIKDAEGRTLHMPKGSIPITYQIHREGSSVPLDVTPLDTPWTDGLFYFSTIQYKRSGNYTISFIAEGAYATALKPLVFPVTVSARTINSGAPSALQSLIARGYLDERDREVSVSNRQCSELLDVMDTDLDAVKSALLMLYYALPRGCLHAAEGKDGEVFSTIAEIDGWSDLLDQMWQGRVSSATTAQTLMESVLLLEYYINKQWIDGDQARVLTALPNFHFAVRCCSLASVALRIFTMDRSINYSYTQATKSKRIRTTGDKASAYREEEDEVEQYGSKRQRKPVQRLYSNADVGSDEENDDRAKKTKRSTRAAVASTVPGASTKDGWVCANCSCHNSSRARSCEACSEKKTSQAVSESRRSSQATARSSRNVSYAEASDDDEDEDGEEGDDSDEDSNDEESDENEEDEAELEDSKYNRSKIDLAGMIESKKQQMLSNPDETTRVSLLCLEVLLSLYEYPGTDIFWAPVDTKLVPRYKGIIATPMDLGTIANQVNAGFYGRDHVKFQKKVNLVWDNCKQYNHGLELAELAEELSEYFESTAKEAFGDSA